MAKNKATWNPLDHHRGPFLLQLNRSTPTRKMKWHTEILKGTWKKEDVEAEARACLKDRHDSIDAVHVWSVREQQHVMTFR